MLLRDTLSKYNSKIRISNQEHFERKLKKSIDLQIGEFRQQWSKVFSGPNYSFDCEKMSSLLVLNNKRIFFQMFLQRRYNTLNLVPSDVFMAWLINDLLKYNIVYTRWYVTDGTIASRVILRGITIWRYRIEFFHTTFHYRESRVWEFDKYA